jgi:hypothetical protein
LYFWRLPSDNPVNPVSPVNFFILSASGDPMCRNIKTLFNFEPPATEEEIRAASLQFVRKLSGFNAPSQANRAAFERATADVAAVARTLMQSLVTTAPPRDREVEAARAKARAAARFGDPRDA